jgi:hypothetical protein
MKRVVTWLLLLLLAGAAAWFGWRRFEAKPPPPVDLTKHDGKTIDFSSGKPVVKDTPEDRAALEKAQKEMAEATKGVTFQAPNKKPEPPPAPVPKQ